MVLSDCDGICNIDIKDMIAAHEKSGADLTMAIKRVPISKENAEQNIMVSTNESGEITDLLVHPTRFDGTEADVNLNIWVVSRKFLQNAVVDAQAHGFTSFSRDIIARNIGRAHLHTYRFDGVYASINSMLDYYNTSMQLLGDGAFRRGLFNESARPILTKVRNSAPTQYMDGASVKNSLIADGCEIHGTVENSILFRGVKIGKGTVVKNSILFMDTYTGENVSLNCVLADKYVLIRDNTTLSGHPELPLYIEKGRSL